LSAGKQQELDLLMDDEGVKNADITLEPGESYEKEILLPILAGQWVAYKVRLQVESQARLIWRSREAEVWERNVIVLEDSDEHVNA
jgi:hypothetical protein